MSLIEASHTITRTLPTHPGRTDT
ncbi:MAG: hypothetical protein K0Q72_5382, partial [Armatimonadetes bacterium]|nr:hypothetical protein [Armatimonadota bacterium]